MKKLSKSMLALTCIALLACFTMLSCKSRSEKQGEQLMEETIEKSTGEDVDVDAQGQKLTIETEQGKAEIAYAGEKWPDDAPADVPEFKFGTIKGSTKSDTPEGNAWTIAFENVPADVLDKYEAELKKAGFKTTKIKVNDDQGTVMAEKGNLNVTAFVGDGKAVISMNKAK
ncbi:MAG: hypothetical protein IPM82_06765 [Saprospiraceae bacterium]|nr:hypothetical protein [Saprospiraceae bacterium]